MTEVLMTADDAKTLDAIVHMLGIEDSHVNPCDVIQTLLDDRNPEALMSLVEELEDLIGPRLKIKIGTPDRWEEYEQIIDICKRLRVLSPKGVPENIIIGACNLLDTIKSEWGDQWSEWDQSIRDGLSTALAKGVSPSRDISGKSVARSTQDHVHSAISPPPGEAMNEAIRALVGQLSYDIEGEDGGLVMVSHQTILAAIEALKPLAEGTHVGCKLAWKQGFCYGDPECYPPPVTTINEVK